MIADLGTILRHSLRTLRLHARALLVGATLFGALVAIIATVANQRIEGHIWESMQNLGVDQQQMLELRQKMQRGDSEAIQDVMASLGTLEEMSDADREQLFASEARRVSKKIFPIIAIGMVGWLIVFLFAGAYYLSMGIMKSNDPLDLLNRSIFFVPRLFGAFLWMGIRSFIWIPLLGIILAFIFGPRFILAPLLMFDTERNMFRAVSQSHRLTNGYWTKIVGNLLEMSVCALLALVLFNTVTYQISVTSKTLGILLHALMQQILIAFCCVFAATLAMEIQKNPKR